MAPGPLTESFNKKFVEARALYDNDELDKALEKAEELLEENGLPHYHRIKCHVLVVACVDDWYDSANLLDRAESLWQMSRMLVTQRGREMGAERDEEAELALIELRDEIDSLKRYHKSERPEEGVDMQGDEGKLMEQGAVQLRGQLEEVEFDEKMDVDVNEGDGAADVAGAAGAEEQGMGAEKAKHQPEHIEEEKEMAHNTSTLPFRPTWSESTDDAKASFRLSGPSCMSTEERLTNEERHQLKHEEKESVHNPLTLPLRSL